MLIDSHVHFDLFKEEKCIAEVVQRAQDAGVEHVVAIGGTEHANQLTVELSKEYPNSISATVGYDRDQIEAPVDFDVLRGLCEESSVVGIGETGLDYFYGRESRNPQLRLLEQMMELSRRFLLPVVLHSREADEDTLAILRQHSSAWEGEPDRKGVLHCFTGDVSFARKLLELGYFISFSGIVTFKNAAALRDVVSYVPSDRLLIETDAPYLAPVPYRGKRNEPAYVTKVAELLADLRREAFAQVAENTARNAKRLFNLPLRMGGIVR